MMAAAILCTIHSNAQTVQLNSPTGRLQATIRSDETHHLTWSLQLNHHPLVLNSPLGITIGDTDLGQDVVLGPIHQTVAGHYRQALIPVTQTKTGIRYQLECYSYDNGFAYRYIVPSAKDSTLVTGEASSWTIPPVRTSGTRRTSIITKAFIMIPPSQPWAADSWDHR